MAAYPYADYLLTQDEIRHCLMRAGKPGIVALGLGPKRVLGKDCEEMSVHVFVHAKKADGVLPCSAKLPSEIDGIPIDVRPSPQAYFAAGRERPGPREVEAARRSRRGRGRVRPLVGGVSCANRYIPSGTLGYFCRRVGRGSDSDALHLLSSGHVFQASGKPQSREIVQAAPSDGGTDRDVVAECVQATKLDLSPAARNLADAAIARLNNGVAAEARILGLGPITGSVEPVAGMEVAKQGRSTGLTNGRVVSVNYETSVSWGVREDRRAYRFVEQVRVEPISPERPFVKFGDSGALVVEKQTRRAVGLFFAGPQNGSYGLVTPIRQVESALGVLLMGG